MSAASLRLPRLSRAERLTLPHALDQLRLTELLAFAFLIALIAVAWGRLLAGAPAGRIALASVVTLLGAAAAQLATDPRRPRRLRVLAIVAPALAIVAGAVIVGIPLRLFAPSGWSELSTNLRMGIRTLSDATYPYIGPDDWVRLVALAAIPFAGGLVAMLAFWRGHRARRLRVLALALGLAAVAVPSIMNSADPTLLEGAAVFCVICAWVWLPRMEASSARLMAVMVAAVAVISIPLVGAFGSSSPLVDYKNWDPFRNIADVSESFSWDQTYGPIDWSRDDTELLKIESHEPHYWRTVVLDRFDGYGWSSSANRPPVGSELPSGVRTDSPNSLNPDWVSKLHYSVGELQSDTVIGAGTILSVHGLDGAQGNGGTRVTVPGDNPLSPGDSYTVEAYTPDPTAQQMRSAAPRFPASLSVYRTLFVPQATGGAFPSATTTPLSNGPGGVPQPGATSLEVPAWNGATAAASPKVERTIARSPYQRTYALAQKLTAGSASEYAAVQAIQRHLKQGYDYSETPPKRRFPLNAFLFKDKIGYCQQFSGSMALMLRLLGIPARVASGFAPGTHTANGQYEVTDLDAHAWVEVYFRDIGWVPFDPTPAASPATRQIGALHAVPSPVRAGPRVFPGGDSGSASTKPGDLGPAKSAASSSSSGTPTALLAIVGVALLLALGVAIFAFWRRRRYRTTSPAAAVDSQLRELERALRRLGYPTPTGSTLLVLERRLQTLASPLAAGYAARIRAYRFAPGPVAAPTLAERKRARHELARAGGRTRRLRAWLAMPPGAPSVPR